MLIKTISNNDARIMALSLSHDGNYIATISEDDINKKYSVEVYDFDYDNPVSSGSTLYSYSSIYEKQVLSWNPKRNVLAFAGEDKEGGLVHLLMPQSESSQGG
jgi:WD40 repeat protein